MKIWNFLENKCNWRPVTSYSDSCFLHPWVFSAISSRLDLIHNYLSFSRVRSQESLTSNWLFSSSITSGPDITKSGLRLVKLTHNGQIVSIVVETEKECLMMPVVTTQSQSSLRAGCSWRCRATPFMAITDVLFIMKIVEKTKNE